jgi:hypothetical protein
MRTSDPPTHFEDAGLPELREAYFGACLELGIHPTADVDARRNLIASMIIDLAIKGETDPAVIQRRVVLRFSNSGPAE